MTRIDCGHDVITGGSGFVGQHLVRELLRQGRRVTIIDPVHPGPLAAARGVRWIQGDVRDPDVMSRGLQGVNEGGVDRLFHLAAITGVRDSGETSEVFDVNVGGTLSVIRSATEHRVGRIIYAGSSSVYGNTEFFPTPESAPLQPLSPYGESKKRAEELILNFSGHESGTASAVVRFFTLFGSGGRPEMAIPTFLRRACSGEELPLLGSPDSFRDYTSVHDALRGLLLVAEAVDLPGPVNIASGRPVRLRELVDVIGRAIGRRPECRWLPGHPLDVYGTHADITVARRLGFAPQVSLSEGIEEILRSTPGRYGRLASHDVRDVESIPEERRG